MLRDLVAKHGAQNWSVIANALPGRNGKSCRWVCRTDVLLCAVHIYRLYFNFVLVAGASCLSQLRRVAQSCAGC
jgi:hypothetical protein